MANPKTLPDCIISIAGPKAQEQPHSGWPLNIPGKLHKNPLLSNFVSFQADRREDRAGRGPCGDPSFLGIHWDSIPEKNTTGKKNHHWFIPEFTTSFYGEY